MKPFHSIFSLLTLLLLCLKPIDAVECTKYVKVAPGDYCYKIWTDNGLTESEFRALNPGINCDALQVGQQVCVSDSSSSSSDCCIKKYKVVSGDNCYNIWTSNNLTQAQFYKFNPGINCDALQIGQEICLAQGCMKKYKIVAGDNCYKIWTLFNLTEAQFHAINPNINCDALQIGQEVCVDPDATIFPSTTPQPTQPSLPGCYKEYQVVMGDTCISLQHDYLVSFAELMEFNPSLDCSSNLQIGQNICFFSNSATVSCNDYEIYTSTICDTIQKDYNLTIDQFKTINYNMDCKKNIEGNLVCVNADTIVFTTTPEPTDPPINFPNTPVCEQYSIKSGDTCYQITVNFDLGQLEFMQLNPGIDCNNLQVDQLICVNKNSDCDIRYSIKAGDTCAALISAYKLTMTELATMNPKLSCNNLQISQEVCVVSSKDRIIPPMDCTTKYIIATGDSCFSMQQQFGITIDELLFLNPMLNCSNLQIGKEICSFGQSSQFCSVFQEISSAHTCKDIYDRLEISYRSFLLLNPTFQCSKLSLTKQLCIGQGYFSSLNCVEQIKLTPTTNDCETIAENSNLSTDQIVILNPTANCTVYLDSEYFICTKSLGSVNVDIARNVAVNVLKQFSQSLDKNFQDSLNSPSKANSDIMYRNLIDTMNILSEAQFTEIYNSNAEFKKVIDADTSKRPRSEVCDEVTKSQFSQSVKTCVCNSDVHFFYCQAKIMKEMQIIWSNIPSENSTSLMQSKSILPCEFQFPRIGSPSQFGTILSGCVGGGCSVPLPPVTLDIEANICVPLVTFWADNFKFCFGENKGRCETIDGYNDQLFMNVIEKFPITAAFKLCVGEPIKTMFENLGIDFCIDLLNFEYKWFVGVGTISTIVTPGFGSLRIGGTFKIHDMLYSAMCGSNAFDCEPYCLWNKEGAKNGRGFGILEIKMGRFLSYEGYSVVDKKFGEPRTEKCNPDELSAVFSDNRRTCDKDVEIYCWSGDDKVKRQPLHEEGFMFPFTPMKNTLWVCQWHLMSTGQMIGFDVFGGRSNLHGLRQVYYAVKNDGIYYGELRGEENKLVDWTKETKTASWDKVCAENGDDGGKINIRRKGTVVHKDDDGDDNNGESIPSEPTGISSVPAASCNKRIVGYYTGWSKREVDENQLRKLTHIIFAFVAMKADGSIAFDKVSDDSEADAGKIAKKRFMDLKTKARKVNAGVKISFAIGGWDNSQYYSSVAGDSGKRTNFVNSVVKFLKDESLDGIDLDWEYPVTGGAHEGTPADKPNFVELLKELREALNKLQKDTNRKHPYIISYASAAGDWTIRPAYDLENIMKYVDFINLMTYDYFGAWGSQWGKYTGPPAPLFYGAPKGFSGKLNADYTAKYYSCKTKTPSKINMGVPFYGRYWNNVGGDIDGDEMWRTADAVDGVYEGGYIGWRDIGASWNKGAATVHPIVKSPYIWDAGSRKYLGFENEESLKYKVDYAIDKNIGGLMIWAIDLDDDANSLLKIVSSANLCSGGTDDSIKYKCVPIDDIRWWTPENGGPSKQGMCGKSAPLINGYYPVCDPDDPGYSCCGPAGYCGSGKDYCSCDGCVDYRANPDLIIKEPTKPTHPLQWYTMDAPDGERGRCGPTVPKLNGKDAICNPDDDTKYCCSNGGYCGIGDAYCKCNGCINFRDNPNYQWP